MDLGTITVPLYNTTLHSKSCPKVPNLTPLSASAILGYTAAELLGSSGYNFYHDEDLNALARSHVDCKCGVNVP